LGGLIASNLLEGSGDRRNAFVFGGAITLKLHAREAVICCAASSAGLYQQMAAVLAGGSCARVEGMDLPPLPHTLATRLSQPADAVFTAALFEGDLQTSLRFRPK
jgi:delta 1-pyrroline-5-carboxylate dehydrogenase